MILIGLLSADLMDGCGIGFHLESSVTAPLLYLDWNLIGGHFPKPLIIGVTFEALIGGCVRVGWDRLELDLIGNLRTGWERCQWNARMAVNGNGPSVGACLTFTYRRVSHRWFLSWKLISFHFVSNARRVLMIAPAAVAGLPGVAGGGRGWPGWPGGDINATWMNVSDVALDGVESSPGNRAGNGLRIVGRRRKEDADRIALRTTSVLLRTFHSVVSTLRLCRPLVTHTKRTHTHTHVSVYSKTVDTTAASIFFFT